MNTTNPLQQQVSQLRSVTFALVDDLVSRSSDSTALNALTHMQDVANKLGVVESLLAAQARSV